MAALAQAAVPQDLTGLPVAQHRDAVGGAGAPRPVPRLAYRVRTGGKARPGQVKKRQIRHWQRILFGVFLRRYTMADGISEGNPFAPWLPLSTGSGSAAGPPDSTVANLAARHP